MTKIFMTSSAPRWAAITLSLLILLIAATDVLAVSSQFRKQFIFNRRANLLLQQEALVKENKDIVPTEIDLLVTEALAFDKTFEERMYLLDNAKAMASVYSNLFGDGKFVAKIETIQEMALAKEEVRQRELERWKSYMGLRGAIVMKEHIMQMESEGYDPVVYPHWMHRLLFKCKACHNEIFVPIKGANDINHEKLKAGKQCATCHNGTIAFSSESEEKCARCHISGGAEKVTPYAFIDNERIKESASIVGATWAPENLPDGRLPLDSGGAIDWIALEESGVMAPVASPTGDVVEETRDQVIVFATEGSSVGPAIFDEMAHSKRIDCATCHTAIFKEKLGANDVTMEGMGSGMHCGSCHGVVSFPLTDCNRCHIKDPASIPADALRR